MPIDVKAPQDLIDALPQEAVTGEVLRGRGPRRGNLEDLLRYWRPIMRKPGGFRRCLVILADHPELYPLENLCAWLHHETTGKWPNEKTEYTVRRVSNVTPRTNTKTARRTYRREDRDRHSMVFHPLSGNANLVDFKIDRYIEGVASTLLPGEAHPFRFSPTRQAAYSALFGDSVGPRIGGPRGGAAIGTGRRNPYRCPPGFERGGRFTNRFLSTCGQQLMAVPGAAVTPAVRREAVGRRNVAGEVINPSTSIETSQVQEARLSQLRGAVPPKVTRPNPGKKNSSVSKLLSAMVKAQGDKPLARIVRQDGTVLTPLAPVSKLAAQRDNEDLLGSSYLTRVTKPNASTGVEELGLFNAGVRQIGLALPGNVRATLTASNKLSGRDVAVLKGRAASLARSSDFPMAALAELAGTSNLVSFEAEVIGMSEPNKKIRVQNEAGVSKVVPKWLFLLFLSEEAPHRPSGKKPFKIVEEIGGPTAGKADASYEAAQYKVAKFLEPPRFEEKDEHRWGPLEYTASPIPPVTDSNFQKVVDYKAASWLDSTQQANSIYSEKRANVVWDPKLGRYRCPPGTQFGGRITNRMGAGCGGSILRRVVGAVRGAANGPDVPQVPGARAAARMDAVSQRERARTPRRLQRDRADAQRGMAAVEAGRARQAAEEVDSEDVRARRAVEIINEGRRAAQVAEAKKIGAFGRALARLADKVDVDVENSENIVQGIDARIDLGIDEANLPPERRRRLALMGARINDLVNQWADKVDVDLDNEDEDVVDLPARTAGRRDVDVPGRRQARERQGIARRERQINRRDRLRNLADRIDPDVDRGEVRSVGGPLRNPDRREIRSRLEPDFHLQNPRVQERMMRAARHEWDTLDGWWAARLGRPDFDFRDIQRYVKKRESENDVGEDIMEHIRRQRDDWAELRPVFEPIEGLDLEPEEITNAFNRLEPNRWGRIFLDANPNQTNERVMDAIADRDKQLRRLDDEALAFQKEINTLVSRVKDGNLSERRAKRFIEMGYEITRSLDRAKVRVKELERLPLIDLADDPAGAVRQEIDMAVAKHRVDNLSELVRNHGTVKTQNMDAINKALRGRVVPPPQPARPIPTQPTFEGGNFNTPRPELPKALGQIGDMDANGMPMPREIKNGNIQSKEAAIEFVKRGGSLEEVPNEYWLSAIRANSSSTPEDRTTRFLEIPKKGGAIGKTYIFVLRGADGKRTEKGWVFKATTSANDNAGEQAGWALAAVAGFQYDVAGWDGNEGRNQFVVLPYVGNVAREGNIVKTRRGGNFGTDVYQALPDKALPQRLAHLLHNFTLQVADRHSGNGMSFIMDGEAFALPIDLGWAGRGSSQTKADSWAPYFMDHDIFRDMRTHLQGLDEDEAVVQARKIIAAYDTYVANMSRVATWNRFDFAQAQVQGLNKDDTVEEKRRAGQLYDLVVQRVDHLRADRDRLLNAYIPGNVLDRINTEDNPPEPNALIPDNEVKVNDGLASVDAAVAHLEAGGDLNMLPGEIMPQAIMAVGALRGVDGKTVDPNVILKDGDDLLDWRDEVGKDYEFENDRFKFKYIKPNADKKNDALRVPGPWDVFEVEDKHTGKVYYFKSSGAGVVEGMNEMIGADIARLVGFDHDDEGGGLRMGPPDADQGWRWLLIPHVAQYNQDEADPANWQDLNVRNAAMPGPGQLKMNPRDIAQIGVMDFLMNNHDRNAGNIKVHGDNGDLRVAPIDHALMGAAIYIENADPAQRQQVIDDLGKWAPWDYYQVEPNNPFGLIFNKERRLWIEAQREEIAQRVEEIMEELKDLDVDELFNPDRLGRHGVKWNATELQHMDAIKQVFAARLERLKNDPRLMMQAFEKQLA